MSGGYAYGDLEPKERCPYCNALCCADFVDVGVGMVQCGPYHCERCGASECGPYDNDKSRHDPDTGWYPPGSLAGSSANVDERGNHISWHKADGLYRAQYGVPPRYNAAGRLIQRD